MDNVRVVTAGSDQGGLPFVASVSNSPIPVLGVKPQTTLRTPREIYALVATNPGASLAYIQVLAPSVSGNVVGVLGAAGAKSGVTVTVPQDSAPIVTGTAYLLDTGSNAESVTVTVTAGPVNNADGSTTWTVSFTTTLAHTATVTPIMGGVTLGTTAPKQSYGIPAGQTVTIPLSELGIQFLLGYAIAATAGWNNNVAPSAANIVNLSVA